MAIFFPCISNLSCLYINLLLYYTGEPAAQRGVFLSFILISLTCSSGCFVFLQYAETIFSEADPTSSPQISSIIVAVIQMSGSYISTFFVEKAGRKFLIIYSSFGAALCLTIMGIYSLAKSSGCDVNGYKWIPLFCLSGVVFIAANGSASLPYLVVCEILGQKVIFQLLQNRQVFKL